MRRIYRILTERKVGGNGLFNTMKFKLSFKKKMVLATIAISLVVGVIATTAVFITTQRAITALAIKYMDSVVTQQESAIEDMFANAAMLARTVAAQKAVLAYMHKKDPALQDAELIENFKNIDVNGWYQSIYIMDRTGKTLTSTDPSFIGQNYSFREYFKSAIEGKEAIDAAIGATTGKFGYFFASPIKNDEGEPIGVVAVKLKDSTVDAVLHPSILGKEGAVMLVDEYGIVIQSGKSELLFKSLGQLTPEMQETIAATGRFRNRRIGTLQYEELQNEIKTLQNTKAYTTYDTAKQTNMVVAMTRIKGSPFFIVMETPVQDFAATAKQAVLIISLILIMGAIMTPMLLLVMFARFSRPLTLLKDSALKIALGDFKQRVFVKTGDEFEELGNAFNAMIDKLNDVYINLEAKVWERTADFEKFRLAVEATSDPVVITDIDGRIVYTNKAMEGLTGYARNEMLGSRPSLWGRQMSSVFYEQMWNTIKRDKKEFHGELTNRRKGGDRYTAEIHISPLLMEKNRLYGFVGVERDITKQKELERSRVEFVSIASHQLRTPLSVINWYIEMLLQGDVGNMNEEQRKYLEQVSAASRRMINLVNALLSVSRVDLETFSVLPEPLVLANVANDVLTELQPQIDKKKLTIIKEYEPAMPQIDADPMLLRVVFQNILSNAVHYTPQGGTITAAIRRKDDETALIEVTDNGIGIPEDQQVKMFQKFFRADNAREMEPDGNGLGLYVAKAIIDYAGGNIRFSSKEDKGSTFFIELPLTGMQKRERVAQ